MKQLDPLGSESKEDDSSIKSSYPLTREPLKYATALQYLDYKSKDGV